MNTFGRYLRIRRRRAGLSLRDVARVVRIGAVYLGEVERAARPPLDRRHWPRLAEAIPGVNVEALEWAAASSGLMTVDLTALDHRARFAALAALKGSLPDEPMELQEDALDSLRTDDNPGIVPAMLEVLGDEQLSIDEITDALVALGWMADASNLRDRVGTLLFEHRRHFVRVGDRFQRGMQVMESPGSLAATPR